MPNRPYQTDMVAEIEKLFLSGYRRVLLQCPTGGGKTRVAVQLAGRAGTKNVLYVVPTREIFVQTSVKLTSLGVEHTCLTAGKYPSLKNVYCVLAMSQTLSRRTKTQFFRDWKPNVIIIDEIHRLIDQHRLLLNLWDTPVLGMTATPVRLDGQPLSDLCPTMIVGPSIRALQGANFLVPCRTYRAPMPDLKGLKIRRGDFERKHMENAFLRSNIPEVVPQYWRKFALGRRTITFSAGVRTSKKLVAAYRQAGIRAEHIDSSTSNKDRDDALERLRKKDIDVLCNVGLFIEGLDIIEVECVTLVVATASLAKFLQAVGRGLRLSPGTGKQDLVVIDHGGNSVRHGPIDADRDWAREGVFVGSVPVPCRACGAYRSAEVLLCAHCGWEEKHEIRYSKIAVKRSHKNRSKKTKVRPCPQWAIQVREIWQKSELERIENGYRLPDASCLGYAESRCRRALKKQGHQWTLAK